MGCCDGSHVGKNDGAPDVGSTVGVLVGARLSEGTADGFVLGLRLGLELGTDEGASLGSTVSVGLHEGRRLGLAESVGKDDGSALGWPLLDGSPVGARLELGTRDGAATGVREGGRGKSSSCDENASCWVRAALSLTAFLPRSCIAPRVPNVVAKAAVATTNDPPTALSAVRERWSIADASVSHCAKMPATLSWALLSNEARSVSSLWIRLLEARRDRATRATDDKAEDRECRRGSAPTRARALDLFRISEIFKLLRFQCSNGNQ